MQEAFLNYWDISFGVTWILVHLHSSAPTRQGLVCVFNILLLRFPFPSLLVSSFCVVVDIM